MSTHGSFLLLELYRKHNQISIKHNRTEINIYRFPHLKTSKSSTFWLGFKFISG